MKFIEYALTLCWICYFTHFPKKRDRVKWICLVNLIIWFHGYPGYILETEPRNLHVWSQSWHGSWWGSNANFSRDSGRAPPPWLSVLLCQSCDLVLVGGSPLPCEPLSPLEAWVSALGNSSPALTPSRAACTYLLFVHTSPPRKI